MCWGVGRGSLTKRDGTNLGVVHNGLLHYGAYLKFAFGKHDCC